MLPTYWAVEYPGYVENEVKALETLGGLANIEECFVDDQKVLECRYRPKSLTCHPINGNLCETQNILVRLKKVPHISVEKEGDKQYFTNAELSQAYDVETEFVGVIDKTYRFREMPDFQYHYPIDNKNYVLASELQSFDTKMVEEASSSAPFMRTPKTADSLNNLPMPPYFSRARVPFDYRFKQCSAVKVVTEEIMVGDTEVTTKVMLKNMSRTTKRLHCHNVTFNDPIPTEPIPVTRDEDRKYVAELENTPVVKKMREMFAERPLWTRWKLTRELGGVYRETIKIALPLMAYFVTKGPWRNCWVRLGYDPKGSQESRVYQLIDLRLKSESPGISGAALSQIIQHSSDGDNTTDEASNDAESANETTLIQLCDVKEPSFVAIMNMSQLPLRSTPDAKDGWFVTAQMIAMRRVIMKLIRTVIYKELKPEQINSIDPSSYLPKLPWNMAEHERAAFVLKYTNEAVQMHEDEQTGEKNLAVEQSQIRRQLNQEVDRMMEDFHVATRHRQLENNEDDMEWAADDVDEYEFFE